MKRTAVTVLLLLFGAASIEAKPTLYGPSNNELVLQGQLDQHREIIMRLSQRINALNERVSGLTTVIEGLNRTIGELKSSGALRSKQNEASGNLVLLEAKVARLESECVKKNEIGSLTTSQPKSKKSSVGKSSAKSKSSSEKQKATVSLELKGNATLYSEGVRLFQKQKYDEAKKRFEITRRKGYKPAASNYYLGEIAYYTHHYNDAIFYFKKSAEIYDQASYIDTLLLHTAVSLEKTGDKVQAKTFYQTIIDGYPEKKSARIAKKKIRNL